MEVKQVSKYLWTKWDFGRTYEGRSTPVHNVIAQILLGRSLVGDQVVHHIDEDKFHNTFDNIFIFDSRASHARFHNSSLYWLEIKDDMLTCNRITKEQKEDFLT